LIDEEVRTIVEGQYERAKKILSDNKDKLIALATQLLEKEVIFKEDLEKIFGDRPFPRETMAEPLNGNGTKTGPELADPQTEAGGSSSA
jgi:hypothetical protein